MLKRIMRAALRARSYHSQTREIRLRILTHNLAILWRKYYVLYRAGASLVFPSFPKRGLYRINRYKPQDKISVNLLSYTILRYSNHHIVNPGRLTCALDSYP